MAWLAAIAVLPLPGGPLHLFGGVMPGSWRGQPHGMRGYGGIVGSGMTVGFVGQALGAALSWWRVCRCAPLMAVHAIGICSCVACTGAE